MKKPSTSAATVKELIEHAIHDLEVTPDEYQSIMDCVNEDGHMDREEQALLSQFHAMINDGTIKRVKGSQ